MKKILNILTIFIIILPMLCAPEVTQALTLAQFEKQVEDYTAELTSKQNAVAKNDEEVAKIKKQIQSTENQIISAKYDITRLEKDIDALNDKIYSKQEEVKKIVNFVQKSNGISSYLEYIFGAKSFTELIYRAAVAEQMSSYNERLVKEYNDLIEQNKKKQEDLRVKNEENAKLQVELAQQKSQIEASSEIIRGTMPSVEERIQEAKKNVEYYKNLGCGKNEDIQDCQYRISSRGIPAANGFYKPTLIGKITNPYVKNIHLGYDIVSTTSDKNIAVHPIAQGQVYLIYSDSCTTSNWCDYGCNGNARIVVIRHNVGGKYIYSSYVHLSSYGNIQEGQIVFPTTIIGYMGTSGCSTANHLHLEMATCYWKTSSLGAGGCLTYSQYLNSIISPANYIGVPNQYGFRW